TVQELAADLTPTDRNPTGENVPELIIQGATELSIFRYRWNSEPWDFPRDAPSRYEAIGFFRGNGGVKINLDQGSSDYGRVTVIDRNGYERSQLAIRSIYELRVDPRTNNETYLDLLAPLGGVGVPRVAAPVISTVDFNPTPPDNVINTPFPEKVVLAFYAATCGGADDTLCLNATYDLGWQARDFLTGDALSAFNANNPAYFGLPSFSGNQNISISQVRYHPALETDPDLLVTGGGRDVVTGEEGQQNLVDIIFTVNGAPLETRRYEMSLVEGQWKIFRAFRLIAPPAESPMPAVTGEPEVFPFPALTPASNCVQNTPPVAEANGPYTGLISQGRVLITFSAAGSSDADGTIQTYTWDFGDGSPPGSGPSAGHDYVYPGVYTAILTVTDNCGTASQDTAKVTIAVPK
ncbi:MAG TPA: PKD domain-containing protein, partial [Anaerolineae bacterium]|nr:PKD domain-containing protein [Anaerolineae bacterium]